ncbi:hypothetical protein GCK72_018698 [Caenorhabditis remanei]|uniref:Uncharacterized protein n=1 Tax=Caenorhabditis remanei TaxID=31234 RepID=A0A6A5GBN2_CAERE|nr:hypothetical protein GCK72_018698 [Caenorhabditis remanei]KAF1752144.1 hypothetical protein GCK72_018698 [Caenorhabditis remanei]
MIAEIAQPGDDSKTCLVCTITENVRHHFGSTTCLACASFFRRTVSLNIQYICKQSNACPVSFAVRSGCRSCRFQNCLKAGMKTTMVRGKRDINKVPKYVRENMKQGNEMIIRDYATSSFETLHGFPRREEAEKPMENEDVLKLLNITADQLLEYYLELNEKEPCPLRKISFTSFFQLNQQNHFESTVICRSCPGTDLLNPEDVGILFQYTSFANLWIDALWDEIHIEEGKEEMFQKENQENEGMPRLFSDFLTHFYENVGIALRSLNLDIVEYAVLKSFVIWKLGVVDFSTTLKIVAQEHYLGSTVALTEYYKKEKNMDQFEIALRIADLTLLLGPIFNSYREMVNLYEKMQISMNEKMRMEI